ncbi:MAG: alcohol dehydrogenase [Chloroflexi bacterium]|nr:MAG: alcohol dehydrogenase [Chloroflexota bacterium]
MRAIRFSQFGKPADVLRLETVPVPEPAAGEVRVRLTHRSVNPSDLLTVSGLYGRLPELPATPGFEGTGYIDAIGEGVTGWQVGQRVIPLGVSGTWQEYVIANPAQLLPVPDAVADETAAQFVVNPVTAWVMLTEELGLQEGDWVLQTAAGSTLGRLVLQIARLKGYKTVNFVRRREQVDELLALGADAVICTEDEDVVAQVMGVTNGKGVKGALDAVGGRTGALAASCLQTGGTMLVYGLLSLEPTPIHTGEMIFKETTVRGFWLTRWFRRHAPTHVITVLQSLMGLMAEGHLQPPVEATYDLAAYKTAVLHAERPGRQGKILLTG